VFLFGRLSDERLAAALERVATSSPTYQEVGATEAAARAAGGDEHLPAGYHHVRASAAIGRGDEDFAAAVDGIRTWQLHRGQGFRVVPAEPPIALHIDVVVDVPQGPVHIVAACRIVWTVDEPDRFGFGYGTLPLHPESGEEAFVVEQLPSGEVRLTVVAFSRPREWLARLGGPITRRQQAKATDGYVAALVRHVALSRDRGPSAA
jgi:uncharacterized protein (UPF0548 family)